MDLNSLWDEFEISGSFDTKIVEEEEEEKFPKCSEIYISTKTKIHILILLLIYMIYFGKFQL